MPIEREIKGFTYRSGKLATFDKLHVARKIAPMLSGIIAVQSSLSEGAGFDAFVGPIAQAIASMSDDEVEKIVGVCLNVVQRRLPGDTGWVPIWNRQSKSLQFEDMDLPEMLQLVMMVLEDNIGGFLPAAPALSQGPGPAAG